MKTIKNFHHNYEPINERYYELIRRLPSVSSQVDILYENLFLEGLSREEALEKYKDLLEKNPHLTIKNAAGASDPPDYGIRTRASLAAARKERERKIRELAAASIYPDVTRETTTKRGKRRVRTFTPRQLAGRKRRMMGRMGSDVHHITEIEKSYQLMKSMTPEAWRQRQEEDLKDGIHHGDVPRNLMVTSRAGGSSNPSAIPHRKGIPGGPLGVHEFADEVKDITDVSRITLRDLYAAYIKKRRQNQRKNEAEKIRRSARSRKKLLARMSAAYDRNFNDQGRTNH